MKKEFSPSWLYLGFLSFLCVVSLVSAQDVKTLSWEEFREDIRFIKGADEKWDFTHGTRPLVNHTTVAIPAKTLTMTAFYCMMSQEGMLAAIVTLDPKFKVKVYSKDAEVLSENEASVRFLFLCKNESATEGTPLLSYCRQTLNTLLEQGLTVQSAGSGNDGYEKTGIIPEKIIFSFIAKHEKNK